MWILIPHIASLFMHMCTAVAAEHELPCKWISYVVDVKTDECLEDRLKHEPSKKNKRMTYEIARNSTRFINIQGQDEQKISGLIYEKYAMEISDLVLLIAVNCSQAKKAKKRERVLEALVNQRQFPVVHFYGVSEKAGPMEILVEALPVAYNTHAKHRGDFMAPLPIIAPHMSITIMSVHDVQSSMRHIAWDKGENDTAPQTPFDLSCLDQKAGATMPTEVSVRLSRLQRVVVRAPVTSIDKPGGHVPDIVRYSYMHLVRMVLLEFLEAEQEAAFTSDHLVSPMQRYVERTRLLENAGRYFFTNHNISVSVSPNSFQKLSSEATSGDVHSIPHILYIDKKDQMSFAFQSPASAIVKVTTNDSELLDVRIVMCEHQLDWHKCEARVAPHKSLNLTQSEPGRALRWSSVRLESEAGNCSSSPPPASMIAVGCPPNYRLIFNFTSTYKMSGLAQKCPQCVCDRGVPCFLYSDKLIPQLSLVDWATYKTEPYTRPYVLRILGQGYTNKVKKYNVTVEQKMNSVRWRRWAPSFPDNLNVSEKDMQHPVFNAANSPFDGITWNCDQYSDCPPFLLLELSNRGVDNTTFCLHRVELTIFLYGVPTNTFVDVFTMLIVFIATLPLSLAMTLRLVWQQRHVKVHTDIRDIHVRVPAPDEPIRKSPEPDDNAAVNT